MIEVRFFCSNCLILGVNSPKNKDWFYDEVIEVIEQEYADFLRKHKNCIRENERETK